MGFDDFLDKVDVCLNTKGRAAAKQCGETFGPQAGEFGKKIKNGCDLLLSFFKNAASRDLVLSDATKSKPLCAKPGQDYVQSRRQETGYDNDII
mmetsp:Transcript_5092/g.14848  ORF Transcript_5092/g.14848 Transcript_5092/m.14848 type:complete len:94 (+) Transcript_5092:36-317(+)